MRIHRTHLFITVFALLLASLLFSVVKNSQLQHQLRVASSQIKDLQQAKSQSHCEARNTWTPQSTRRFTLPIDDLERSFNVHLPPKFDSHRYYPLIVVYGGKGETAEQVEQLSGLNDTPAIIVYPQAVVGVDGSYAWQGAPYSSKADDIAFTSAVLDKLEGQLCISRNAIYAAGWSNGGGMSWLLSCSAPQRFAAFAAIAGAFYYPETDCHPSVSRSFINIHGTNDRSVPYYGSTSRRLPNIDTWLTRRANQNNCTSQTIKKYSQYHVTQWGTCRDGAVYRNIEIVNGVHSWPAVLDIPFNQLTLQQPTHELLWQFFAQQELP